MFKIKPYITADNSEFNLMFSEIYQMNSDEIQDGIDTCNLAIEGKTGFSWGWEVFELAIEKEMSRLEYHGEFVVEIPTKEVLKMLQDYKNALDFFENNSIRASPESILNYDNEVVINDRSMQKTEIEWNQIKSTLDKLQLASLYETGKKELIDIVNKLNEGVIHVKKGNSTTNISNRQELQEMINTYDSTIQLSQII